MVTNLPNGNLMIQECICGLNLENVSTIYISFLKYILKNIVMILI